MTAPERYLEYIARPMWQSVLGLEHDPFGGMFDLDMDTRRANRWRYRRESGNLCGVCGAVVGDRGLHYKTHVGPAIQYGTLAAYAEVLANLCAASESENV